jgi:hypothetical protein
MIKNYFAHAEKTTEENNDNKRLERQRSINLF